MRGNTNRRLFLNSIGATIGAGLIAGCFGDDDDDTGSGNGDSGNSESREGGDFIWSTSKSLQTINPIFTNQPPEVQITGQLYSNLTQFDHTDFSVTEDLAEDWEHNEDITEWTFHLRDDAEFSNGDPVTAEDVEKTINMLNDPDVGSPAQGDLPIENVKVVDETTVRFTTEYPYVDLPIRLAGEWYRILPADVLEDDVQAPEEEDLGSGPFNLENWTVGDELRASANESYFKTDEEGNSLPYVNEISQRTLPDAQSEISALQTGDTDLMYDVPHGNWKRVTDIDGVNTQRTRGGWWFGFVLKTSKEPFDDNRVRQAWKWGLDKDTMVKGPGHGLAVRGQDTTVSPGFQEWTELPNRYTTGDRGEDLENARDLISEAGYGDSIELTCHIPDTPPIREEIAIQAKDQLSGVFDLNLEVISYDRYLSEVWSQAPLYVIGYATRLTISEMLRRLLHSEGGWNSETDFEDPEFEEKLLAAEQSPDADEREQLYADIQEILQERGPYSVPVHLEALSASQEYVEGYEQDPTDLHVRADKTWLDE